MSWLSLGVWVDVGCISRTGCDCFKEDGWALSNKGGRSRKRLDGRVWFYESGMGGGDQFDIG